MACLLLLQPELRIDLLLLALQQLELGLQGLRPGMVLPLLRGEVFLQSLAPGAQLGADRGPGVAQRRAAALGGNLYQAVPCPNALAGMDIDVGDRTGMHRRHAEQPGRGHELPADALAFGVMAEDEEQDDGGGQCRAQQGQHPARQGRRHVDRAQPLAAAGVDRFLAEQTVFRTHGLPLIKTALATAPFWHAKFQRNTHGKYVGASFSFM